MTYNVYEKICITRKTVIEADNDDDAIKKVEKREFDDDFVSQELLYDTEYSLRDLELWNQEGTRELYYDYSE